MKTFLLLLFCMAPLLVSGQECTQTPADQQPPEPQSSAVQSAQPAPKPGHPLDPNDVAILTGHARGPVAAAYGTAYAPMYAYPAPYSYRNGQHFGFNGFFFPRFGRVRAPFFGPPFGPFFFTGFAAGPH